MCSVALVKVTTRIGGDDLDNFGVIFFGAFASVLPNLSVQVEWCLYFAIFLKAFCILSQSRVCVMLKQ